MRPPLAFPDQRSQSKGEFTLRVLILLTLVGLAAFLFKISELLLMMFGSVMLAVVLCSASYALNQRTGMRRGVALALVVVVLLLVLGGIGYLFGARIATQTSDLAKSIPASLGRLHDSLSGNPWGQQLIDEARNFDVSANGGNILSHALGAVSSVLAVATDLILIFFSGLYLAAQPDLYLRGVLSLTPPRYRSRMAEILEAVYDALRHWLIGQLISMLVVGVLFGVALSLIGVKLAIVLGLIAALSEFIPLVGPVIATIPAVLVALSQGFSTAVWVVLAFLVIQQTESNLLVPFVQRRAVHLPPVVALFATVIFGLLFGIAGLLFAVPLVVVLMVVINMVYVDDILGGPESEDEPRLRALVEEEEPEPVVKAS
ncbi:MAG: AI-2E family transporter [Acidisphaera sp.]|nr:AI-2E family transporter [Acidisphaera sp.]